MVKKRVVLTAVLLLFAVAAMSQDLIVLNNGNVIKARVVKIEGDMVRYKDYADTNGALLTIFNPDILSITYENGTVQSFSASPTANTGTPVAQSTSTGTDSWKQLERARLLSAAKSWETAGDILYWVNALGGAGVGIYLGIVADANYVWIGLVSGIGSGILWGLICGVISNSLEGQAAALAYSPLIEYDWQLEHGSLTTSLGAFAMSGPSLSTNVLAGAATGLGAGLSFRF